MKKLLIVVVLLVLNLTPLTQVMAQRGSSFDNGNRKDSTRSSERKPTLPQRFKASTPSGQRLEERTSNLKERAAKEIDRRISALNRLKTKLSGLKKLSSSQISTLQTQIQSEIDKLNALKTEIQGITDYNALKEKVKSILTEYRIFALFMPKIHIMVASDGILNRADEMGTMAGKLEARITVAKNEGKETASMEAKLTEMKKKIEAAKTSANTALSLVTPLSPTGYPANRITLQEARRHLKEALGSLRTARRLAGEIIRNLKILYPNPTTTLTPTPTGSI